MKKISIIFGILGFFLGFLCFLSTNSIIFSVIVLLIFALDYLFLMRKRFTHYFDLIQRIHSSYHFINSFVISLSVKDSLEEAYKNGIRINNPRLLAETEELQDLSVVERVKSLRDYFQLSIYKMFLNVLDLYQDQGGNILNMADNLLRECTRTEKTLTETLSISYKHLTEFVILWLMSFGILLFMKFSIKDFYSSMLSNPIIVPLIFLFFVICIVSTNLFVNAFTDLTIKEEPKE